MPLSPSQSMTQMAHSLSQSYRPQLVPLVPAHWSGTLSPSPPSGSVPNATALVTLPVMLSANLSKMLSAATSVVVPMMPWITQSNAAMLINTTNIGSATANQSASTATTMATMPLTPCAPTAPNSESLDTT